ncbi:MAG: hypothetical protein ACI9EF_002818 [Pseudohongiellaceae bacterium]|jgi:hypothetical protein
MFAMPIIASVAAFMLLAPTPDTVVEDETGLRFAAELQAPGGPAGERMQQLLGTGCREKFWINVYAYGLYIDRVEAHDALSQLVEGTGKVKMSVKDVARINVPSISRSVRLVMVRDVDGEDMREAFEDFLGARLKTRGTKAAQKKSFANLAVFRDYFANDVSDGTELVFVWRAARGADSPGTLTTKIAGRVVGSQAAPDLAWALFDCYVGKDPISEDSVEDMARDLPKALRAGAKEEQAEAAKVAEKR